MWDKLFEEVAKGLGQAAMEEYQKRQLKEQAKKQAKRAKKEARKNASAR